MCNNRGKCFWIPGVIIATSHTHKRNPAIRWPSNHEKHINVCLPANPFSIRFNFEAVRTKALCNQQLLAPPPFLGDPMQAFVIPDARSERQGRSTASA